MGVSWGWRGTFIHRFILVTASVHFHFTQSVDGLAHCFSLPKTAATLPAKCGNVTVYILCDNLLQCPTYINIFKKNSKKQRCCIICKIESFSINSC